MKANEAVTPAAGLRRVEERKMRKRPLRRSLRIPLASVSLAAALVAGAQGSPSHADEAPVFGWAAISPVADADDRVAIVGHVTSLAAVSGTFELSVTKVNGGNRTQSRQKGAFDLTAGGERSLSRTVINLSDGDDLEVTFAIFVGEEKKFEATYLSR